MGFATVPFWVLIFTKKTKLMRSINFYFGIGFAQEKQMSWQECIDAASLNNNNLKI